jgi:transposase
MAITNCSRSSLMGWCSQYRTQGGSTLLDKRAGGNSAKLRRAQVQELKERLHQYTPRQLFTTPATPDGRFWTVPDLARAVEHWYGIVYQSYTSYHTLFARCGFSYQRVERVFKSRRAAQVMEFQEQLEKNC